MPVEFRTGAAYAARFQPGLAVKPAGWQALVGRLETTFPIADDATHAPDHSGYLHV